MNVLKAYKFRIYPTDEQKEFIIQNFGCARFVYNHLLLARNLSYQQTGMVDFSLTPAKLKKEHPFLKKADSLALANAQLNLDRAFRNFYEGRAGFPKFKTKRSIWQSYTTNNQQHTIYLTDHLLKLPKLKTKISIHLHRHVEGTIRSATISARNREEFYVSLLCDAPVKKMVRTKQAVGLAFSPTHLIEASKPVQVGPPALEKTLAKIAIEKRKLSVRSKHAQRQKKDLTYAKNYQKQKKKVSNLHRHRMNQKDDYLEQLSHMLVEKFDQIFIEAVPHIEENASFSINDWQKLIVKLNYKAEWYEKKIFFVDITELHTETCDNKSQLIFEIGGKLFVN